MNKKTSYLLMIIATVIWGFAFIAQKTAAVLPAFTVGALRSIIAAVFLLLIMPLTDKITKNGRNLIKNGKPDLTRQELIGGTVIGVILSVATACQQIGLEKTDAGKAAFITALYVVIVPIFAFILGGKIEINVLIGVPISVVGFYLLCIKPGMGVSPSDLLVLICAVVFACHITAVDRFSPKCDGVRMSLVQFAVSFLINGLVSIFFEGIPSSTALLSALPSLIFLGIGSSGIAYTLQIIGQKNTDPSVASIILSMEAVFGVIGAAIILGERMLPREYVGCAIVLIAVIIAQIDVKKLKEDIKSRRNVNNT